MASLLYEEGGFFYGENLKRGSRKTVNIKQEQEDQTVKIYILEIC
jgi:hypothetical protein